jgi:hypothetical protein
LARRVVRRGRREREGERERERERERTRQPNYNYPQEYYRVPFFLSLCLYSRLPSLLPHSPANKPECSQSNYF